jgi:hypothetical protein
VRLGTGVSGRRAEELRGGLVEWIDQLDAQLVEGDLGGERRTGSDADGLDDLVADTKPRAQHHVRRRLAGQGHIGERLLGERDEVAEVLVGWGAVALVAQPLQACPGDLGPVDHDVGGRRASEELAHDVGAYQVDAVRGERVE